MLKPFAAFAAAMLTAAPSMPAPVPAPVASLQDSTPAPYFVDLDIVRQIICTQANGRASGTGSYIDADQVLTAWHVVSKGKCAINDVPVTVVYKNVALDIAVLKTSEVSEARMPMSCEAPKAGDDYFAIGYPLAEAFAINRYSGTGAFHRGNGNFNGEAVFRGNSIPGMSGGPVINRDGVMIGILNGGNERGLMVGRLLRDTYICGK